MKKIVILVALATLFVSCNTPSTTETSTDSTTVTPVDTINKLDTAFVDTIKIDG
jgi:uncharacterized lipoprotein YajG